MAENTQDLWICFVDFQEQRRAIRKDRIIGMVGNSEEMRLEFMDNGSTHFIYVNHVQKWDVSFDEAKQFIQI
ncbi:MAG: hypothetical protein KDC71_21410 [Acidobacteria bacterium]|nr:hypothetical protein [Acidobacteriota bacterium]